MSWWTVALLLLGCVAFGAALGTASGYRRRWLVVAAVVAAMVLFLPGMCVTAIASIPYGDPDLLDGRTSCDTLYGVRLPEFRRLGGDGTGFLLLLLGAAGAVTALLLVRRRRTDKSE